MERLVTPAGVVLDPDGVSITATTSGGSGGQHANRAATRVVVVVDLVRALPPELAARAVAAVGPVLRATSSESRSQARNREAAVAAVLARVDAALLEPEERHHTRVPRSSRRARREEKARRARRLRERRFRGEE